MDTAQKIFRGYLIIITVILLYFTALWWTYLTDGVVYVIISTIFVVNIGSTIILYRVRQEFIKPLISTYIFVITIITCPMMAIMWKWFNLTLYFWPFVSLLVVAIYPRKQAIYMGIFLLAIVVLSFFLYDIADYLLNLNYKYKDTFDIGFMNRPDFDFEEYCKMVDRTRLTSMSSIVAAFIVALYFLYHKNTLTEFMQTEYNIEVNDNDIYISIEKLNSLYSKICACFDEKKPYIDPDYTIAQLASALNTNTVYISRAIKHHKDVSFTTFLNIYRIEDIKKAMSNNNNMLKLKHLATLSGFKNQSTFNKVFKLIEGITPTEYCKSQNLDIPDDM